MSVEATAIVTLDRLDGYRVVKELGRVAVRVARPRNRVRDVIDGMRAFLGLTAVEFLSDAERARREAVAALQRNARSIEAHAVIGVRFRIGKGKDGATHVVALGRAVLLDRPLPAVRAES